MPKISLTNSKNSFIVGAFVFTALGAALGITSSFLFNKKIYPKSDKMEYIRDDNKDNKDNNTNTCDLKGKEIRMNAPIILRQQLDKNGYTIIKNNLSQINTKINEFVELMRRDGLSFLNGCKDPDKCECNFRHKRCRLLIAKYESYDNKKKNHFEFYSSNCKGNSRLGVNSDLFGKNNNENESIEIINNYDQNKLNLTKSDLTKSDLSEESNYMNESILEGSSDNEDLQKLLDLFKRDFTDSCVNIIEYIDYIIGSKTSNYTTDLIFIADPFHEGYQHTQDNGYGKPDYEYNNDHICSDFCQKAKPDDETLSCCMEWHQDMLSDSKGNHTPYDYVALFILNGRDITSHQLMIGKADTDKKNENGSQKKIKEIQTIDLDKHQNSDIGYIINQKRDLYHKHSKFSYKSTHSRRNVLAIRFKYYDQENDQENDQEKKE
jgi:hypothetical protein